MKQFNLICHRCQTKYVSKYKPKNNVWYCTKSCANKHHHRRKLEGKCHRCQSTISSSRKYCNPCLDNLREENKNTAKVKRKNYLRFAVKSFVRRLKEQAIAYKGGKCQGCGYNKYNGSMHFHHINSNEKSFSISGKSMSFDRMIPELDKCVLVCANCHGEIHGKIITQDTLLKW